MIDSNDKDKKKCSGKGKVMFTYGIIQLGSSVVSAIALAAIALSFCSIKKESQVFNECVETIQASGKNSSNAVSTPVVGTTLISLRCVDISVILQNPKLLGNDNTDLRIL